MIIWLGLFFLVLAVSLILAYKSMEDYRETTSGLGIDYALFLIRQPQTLTQQIIQSFYKETLKGGFILSLERLFKGSKSALVVFGPTSILQPFSSSLGLLELEDYSQKLSPQQMEGVVSWEVGSRHPSAESLPIQNLFKEIPQLQDDEEFWWQVVVQSKAQVNSSLPKLQQPHFQSVIRAVVVASNQKRAQQLQEGLVGLGGEAGLALLPQPYTASQLVKFYQDRALPHNLTVIAGKGVFPLLTASELLDIVGVK